MSFRILGVDPGSRFTGWAVLDLPSYGKPMGVVSCGLIDAGRDRFPSNLGRIYAELKEVISEYSPSLMSLESIFFGSEPVLLDKAFPGEGSDNSFVLAGRFKTERISREICKKERGRIRERGQGPGQSGSRLDFLGRRFFIRGFFHKILSRDVKGFDP